MSLHHQTTSKELKTLTERCSEDTGCVADDVLALMTSEERAQDVNTGNGMYPLSSIMICLVIQTLLKETLIKTKASNKSITILLNHHVRIIQMTSATSFFLYHPTISETKTKKLNRLI